MNQGKRPPLGLVPKFIWDEVRLFEIEGAISRYKKEKLSIPAEWIEEQNELIKSSNSQTD